MNSPMGTIFAHGTTPPWLPREVAEGRKFAWWAQIMFFLTAVLWFILAIASITFFIVSGGTGTLIVGVFGFFGMLICFLAAVFMKKTVIDAIDQGRFHDAKNDSLIWVIFGLVGFVIPALFLILTYAKLGDALVTQAPVGYQPYSPGTVAVQQPAPYVPPPAPIQGPAPVQQVPPGAPQYHAHQTPMVRCKNCSVQYPVFMHSCPNCGAPKE
ncbi:MAG: hypothetical protein NTY62_02815 [Euryarchaeota archaeon]|nr:hypothetical protein [Euryarchaeota archaeon]